MKRLLMGSSNLGVAADTVPTGPADGGEAASRVPSVSRLVVITGASSGLGLAMAEAVPFPARVVSVSRSRPPSEGIEHVTADLSDPSAWPTVVERIGDLLTKEQPERFVFVHNAGTLEPIGFAGETEPDAYRANVLLNSAAGQVLGHGVLSCLAGRPGTHDIVMITSGAAHTPYTGLSAYGAGKAALDQWVRTAGAEQQERGGVRVSAIAPGVVATAMQVALRATDPRDLPAVDRFRTIHADGTLTEPGVAARRFWRVVEDGVQTGEIIDLRDRF